MPRPLILASASPRRRELLATLELAFTVEPADVDEETTGMEEDPRTVARLLAERKARAVADTHPDCVVLAGDTVVALDGRLYDKPADAAQAREMLQALRQRPHLVCSGIAVATAHVVRSEVSCSTVTLRPFTDDELEAWLARPDPYDKAGGYAIQDETFSPVSSVDGCPCSVIGLPLWRTAELLRDAGMVVPPPPVDRCALCPERLPAR